jgi:predicted nuclease of predicted toxin-antitoxin system
MNRAEDEDLLKAAKEDDRLLITRDKDFGTLIFFREKESLGVILLRISPGELNEVHQQLYRLLSSHTEDELKRSFCVVEAHRYRIRHL